MAKSERRQANEASREPASASRASEDAASAERPEELLAIRELCIHFPGARVARAVDGLELSLARGRPLGVVGESGCGKSLTALSIMGLLPSAARVVSGSMRFDGQELLELSA
ncbi:MAG: ATP-binding cassette domain-containing protein, partial [Myxococcota bacterium]|nr:ATP-binding cassette domain-containing protein [Myxococcota bacterium]